jgi:sec-independent protein translocase protein TatB
MFDVGLTELMVIAVVALVVIGPERLPKVARTAGLLLGRLQRYVSDVKSDINREMQLDELKKMQQEISSQVNSLESSVRHEMREVEGSVNEVVDPLERVRAMASGAAAETSAALPESGPREDAVAGPASGTTVMQGEGSPGATAPTPEKLAAVDGAATTMSEPVVAGVQKS